VKDQNLMWYVCYGSNLCLKRFMCYITGKANPEVGVTHPTRDSCEDQTPPRKTIHFTIGHKLYFAEKGGENWNHLPVAFITPTDVGSVTYVTAYLVSWKQYETLREHEGKKYAYELFLPNIEGIEARTFTHETEYQSKGKPCPLYRDVLIRGLKEWGLSEEEAIRYIDDRIAGR
jgi:hypothetical protein